MSGYLALAFLLLQVSTSLGAAPAPAVKKEVPPPALSPEAQKAELDADLAALGVPTSEITGKIVPGANQVQINSALNTIINARLADTYQKSVLEATQNSQQVLAALTNPSVASALSPSARSQYEAVMDLYEHPSLAYPTTTPAKTTAAGRKLLRTS